MNQNQRNPRRRCKTAQKTWFYGPASPSQIRPRVRALQNLPSPTSWTDPVNQNLKMQYIFTEAQAARFRGGKSLAWPDRVLTSAAAVWRHTTAPAACVSDSNTRHTIRRVGSGIIVGYGRRDAAAAPCSSTSRCSACEATPAAEAAATGRTTAASTTITSWSRPTTAAGEAGWKRPRRKAARQRRRCGFK